MVDKELKLKISIDSENQKISLFNDGLKQADRTMHDMTVTANRFGSAWLDVAKGIGAYDLVASAVRNVGSAFTSLAESGIDYNASMEGSLKTLSIIEGSSQKAADSLEWVEEFALDTPYELEEVKESFVKLRAYGIDPISGSLESLGDAAAGMNKPVMQAVEAMADAVVGENERLKEFGIRASKMGDKVKYSWIASSGETKSTIIKDNAEIIQSTLESIFNEKYGGAMKAQASAWDGVTSNMASAWDRFAGKLMEPVYEPLKDGIKWVTEGLVGLGTLVEENAQTIKDFAYVVSLPIAGIALVGKSAMTVFELAYDTVAIGIVKLQAMWNDFVLEMQLSARDVLPDFAADFVGYDDTSIEDRLKRQKELTQQIDAGWTDLGDNASENRDSLLDMAAAFNSINEASEKLSGKELAGQSKLKDLISENNKYYADLEAKSLEEAKKALKTYNEELKERSEIQELIAANNKHYTSLEAKSLEEGAKALEGYRQEQIDASYEQSKLQLDAWQDYYEEIGDLENAWLLSPERSKAYDTALKTGQDMVSQGMFDEEYLGDFVTAYADSTYDGLSRGIGEVAADPSIWGSFGEVGVNQFANSFQDTIQNVLNHDFSFGNLIGGLTGSMGNAFTQMSINSMVTGGLSSGGMYGLAAGVGMMALEKPLTREADKNYTYEAGAIGMALAGPIGASIGGAIGAGFFGKDEVTGSGNGFGIYGGDYGARGVNSSHNMGYGNWGDISANSLSAFTTGYADVKNGGGYFSGDRTWTEFSDSQWNTGEAAELAGSLRNAFTAFDLIGAEIASLDPISIAGGYFDTAEAFAEHMGKGVLDSIMVRGNVDAVYDAWAVFAEDANMTVIDALSAGLEEAMASQRSVALYRSGLDGGSGQSALAAEYAQNDLNRQKSMMGYAGHERMITLDNYDKMFDMVIRTGPTPEELDDWNRLGQLLITADQASVLYQDALQSEAESKASIAEAAREEAAAFEQQRLDDIAEAAQEAAQATADFEESLIDLAESNMNIIDGLISGSTSMMDGFATSGMGDRETAAYYIDRFNSLQSDFGGYFTDGIVDQDKYGEMSDTFKSLQDVGSLISNSSGLMPDYSSALSGNISNVLQGNLDLLKDNKELLTVYDKENAKRLDTLSAENKINKELLEAMAIRLRRIDDRDDRIARQS